VVSSTTSDFGMRIYMPNYINYWQVYGIEKEIFLNFKSRHLAFLRSYTKDFINPESLAYHFNGLTAKK
jgi:hypothetical protein